VVVAGERYGMGSSRDWAAKGQRLLGIRAVLAMSFERIHRANLIGMGILPILLDYPLHMQAGAQLHINTNTLAARAPLAVTLIDGQGARHAIKAKAAVETHMEVELLNAGGVIPFILKQHL
jgi:aconitate hydratase